MRRRAALGVPLLLALLALAVWISKIRSSPTSREYQVKQVYTQTEGLSGDSIRTIHMGRTYLWLGYAGGVGVGNFDGTNFAFLKKLEHVNALLVVNINGWDTLFVGTDRHEKTPEGGFWLYTNLGWSNLTSNLPDHRIYDIVLYDGDVYVATWKGVAQTNLAWDGWQWSVPFSKAKNLFFENIHAMAFLPNGDAWFGSIDHGVSWKRGNKWVSVSSTKEAADALLELGSNAVRVITVSPEGNQVWIGSDGGEKAGVTVYDYRSDEWQRLRLPDNRVMDIAFDVFGRPWVATLGGTFYQNGGWQEFVPYPSMSLAFGCIDCAFDQSHLFIATDGFGLVHAELEG